MTEVPEKYKDLEKSIEDFEERFRKQTEKMREERAAYWRMKKGSGEKRHGKNVAGSLGLYKAKLAAKEEQQRERKLRGEGIFRRTFRLVKGLSSAAQKYSDHSVYPAEKRFKVYGNIMRDCWAPLFEAGSRLLNTAWSFACTFGRDFWDFVLYIADLLITLGYYTGSVLLFLWDIIWDIRYWFESRKYLIFQIFAGSVAAVVLAAVAYGSVTFYEYSYHGQPLGVVRSKEDVYKTIEILGDKLSKATGVEVSLDMGKDISFRTVRGTDIAPSSKEDILDTITYMDSIEVNAFAINVDGRERVITESEAQAKNILSSIQREFSPIISGVEYTSVEFGQNVSITGVTTQLGDIWNTMDALRYLRNGTLSRAEDAEKHPILTVRTKSIQTYAEPVDFTTKYVNNPDMYLDEQEVISFGIRGSNEVVAEVTAENGEVLEKTEISRKVISDPVEQVMYQGTKPLPATIGTGTFIYPLDSYTLTSRFGMRWGRMHWGIDLAAPYGTKIKAADGGTVIFTGWNNARGYYVIIDHGGLFETLYEHCNKILVEEGEQVYQGKTIALVGNTGYSKGPHCHFEVHYKGKPVNPLEYL